MTTTAPGTTTSSPVQHRRHLIHELLESGSSSIHDIADPMLRAQLQTAFRTTGDLLAALHERWTELLERNLDIALNDEDPALAMGIAWDATVLCSPRLRQLLDEYGDHPLMRALCHRERVRLGRLTGLGAGGVALAVRSFSAT